jgi:hypothetical protein
MPFTKVFIIKNYKSNLFIAKMFLIGIIVYNKFNIILWFCNIYNKKFIKNIYKTKVLLNSQVIIISIIKINNF